mmetsp:Transcript_24223/g.78112  ORF Transcript_24223/g.78112 Transcript_24223/m.78112 type:complete len:200 (-) Transcript_24223:464-1063(-)
MLRYDLFSTFSRAVGLIRAWEACQSQCTVLLRRFCPGHLIDDSDAIPPPSALPMVPIDVELPGEAIAPDGGAGRAVVVVVRRFFSLVLAGLRVCGRRWFESHPAALLRRFLSSAASTLLFPIPSKRRTSPLSTTPRIDIESPGLSFPTVKSTSRARSSPSKLSPSHRPPNFVIFSPCRAGLTSKPLANDPASAFSAHYV